MKLLLGAAAACSILVGCSTGVKQRVVSPASAADKAVLFDQLKPLAGTWESLDAKGNPDGSTSVFSVSSAGSAVREIMMVGTAHEMTNMYHLDGDSVVCTHYCAEGNQPRMRATPATARPGRIEFKFDSVTNHTRADQECMGEMTLIIKDADHIRQEWCSYKDGKAHEPFGFELRRKQ